MNVLTCSVASAFVSSCSLESAKTSLASEEEGKYAHPNSRGWNGIK